MVRKTVLDKISNLPSDVMVKILSHLTLKEAVRTSILSSKWRYQSSMLPDLVFDSNCVSTIENRTTFVKIVDRLLLGHISPIRKLTLSYRDDQLAASDIDRWILHLSRNSVKELILNIWRGPRYKLTSCFFSCQGVNHLALYRCLLKPPSTFQGFLSLKRLDIQHVTIAQDVFEGLIVCCPVLEKLILLDCDGFTHLKINAPNLQILYVSGDFEAVSLENAVNLVDVIVSLDAITHQALVHDSSSNLVKFFDHLPHVIRLTVESDFLKYLAVGDLPGKLPKSCLFLNFLSLDILFSSVEVIFTALCLLRSSPTLQELRIRAIQAVDRADVEEVNSWLYHDNYNCSLTQLRIVHITGILGVKAELDLIRYLLLNSLVLEIFTVKPASVDGSWDLVKKLLRFGRVSVHSEIIFLDP